MATTIEQLASTHTGNMEALQSIASHAFTGLQRLVELNMATGSASLSRAFNNAQSVLAVRDSQQLLTLQANLFPPMAMRYVSYSSHVYDIATETGVECFQAIATMVERAEQSMPEGAPAVSVIKSAVNASQKAIEAAQGTARKAVELAESNLESEIQDQAQRAESAQAETAKAEPMAAAAGGSKKRQ